MLYVVLIPGWVWVALSISAWATLAYVALRQLRFRNRVLIGLLAVMAIQALAASSTAVATDLDPISRSACLMGYFGIWAVLFLSLAEACALIFLSTIWPRGASGKRLQFTSWASIWFIFNSIALLAHMRSMALCTV